MDLTRYLTILFTLVVLCSCQDNILQYSLTEGPNSKDFMKNVGSDSGVDTSLVPSPEYNFEQGQDWQELFVLDKETGLMTTNGVVDRELVCPELAECSVDLEIIVTSSISSVYYELIQVTVFIMDINDNSPHFGSDEIEQEIMENAIVGVKLPLPRAIDLDSPANGVKGYRLLNPVSQFTLEAEGSSGIDLHPVLVLQTQLDRETLDVIQLELVAFDSTNTTFANTAQLKVLITVLDVNDNPPEFTQQEYSLTLDEDHGVMSTLLTVEATDPDLGENGELVYSFDDTTSNEYTSIFNIHSETGELVLISNLDFEDTPQIELIILATEQNPSNMPAQTKVSITVVDINDNKPVITFFTNSPDGHEGISIKENLQAGAFLARLKVTDEDSGPNGEVTCEMETLNPDVFLLQLLSSDNYKFITNKSLDREHQSNYTIVFLCRDGGLTSQQETRLTKVVVVKDENDNTPMLTKSNFSFTLHENNPVGPQLLQLQASDPDSGANGEVRYALLSSPTQYINIHPHTGSITTLVAFDYEQDSFLHFLVAAYDQGEPSRTATATIEINVLDTNDEPPIFRAKHYVFTVLENLKLGADVGQVTATDPDSSEYNKHYFTFVSGGPYNSLFAIEPSSGNIYTRTSFDRELKDFYQIQVKAYDRLDPSLFSVVNVTVTIDDQNDHAPVIAYPQEGNNTISVGPVPSDVDQPLLKILATDDDLGHNAVLDYLLESDHGDVFIVDQSTGDLYVKDTDKLYTQNEYNLYIKVQDQGDMPLFVMVQVMVLVETDPEVLATNTVIIIVVGVISGIVVSSLVISITLILFKRKAKLDKEKHLGAPGKHYTVKPVDGDGAADNVSELSVTVLNNSQQAGNNDTHGDRSVEIRPSQPPSYDPMAYDLNEAKDKLSETSNSDSGLGSYEDSHRIVHRLSPTDDMHIKGVLHTLTPSESGHSPCKPSPTDSAYGTDVMVQKQKGNCKAYMPNQHQSFIQTRNVQPGVHYPMDTNISKNYNLPANQCLAHPYSQVHQLTPEGIPNMQHQNVRKLSSSDQNSSRQSSPVRQPVPQNPSPSHKVQHIRQKSEPESLSAASTPAKQSDKSAIPLSQRSNSSGPYDRHQKHSNNQEGSISKDRHRSSSQNAAQKPSQRHSKDTDHDPQLSPRKSRHTRDNYQVENTRKPRSTYNNVNNVAGHEISMASMEKEHKSPHKSRKSKRNASEMLGTSSHGEKQNREMIASPTGVHCSPSFNSPEVAGMYHNKTPQRDQHLNRYPRDNASSNAIMPTQDRDNTRPSCDSTPNLSSFAPRQAHNSDYMNYRDGTGQESVV